MSSGVVLHATMLASLQRRVIWGWILCCWVRLRQPKVIPARYFYEGEGGRVVAERPGAVAGKPVREVAFGWAEITPATSTRVR